MAVRRTPYPITSRRATLQRRCWSGPFRHHWRPLPRTCRHRSRPLSKRSAAARTMTLFLSFRERAVAGGIIDGVALEGDGSTSVNNLKVVDWYNLRARVAGRNILFAVHGFNVNMASGACSFSRLEQAL